MMQEICVALLMLVAPGESRSEYRLNMCTAETVHATHVDGGDMLLVRTESGWVVYERENGPYVRTHQIRISETQRRSSPTR